MRHRVTIATGSYPSMLKMELPITGYSTCKTSNWKPEANPIEICRASLAMLASGFFGPMQLLLSPWQLGTNAGKIQQAIAHHQVDRERKYGIMAKKKNHLVKRKIDLCANLGKLSNSHIQDFGCFHWKCTWMEAKPERRDRYLCQLSH